MSFMLLSLIIGLGVWFIIGSCREGLTTGEDTQQETSSTGDSTTTTPTASSGRDDSTATPPASSGDSSNDDTEPSKKEQNMADIEINQAVKKSDNIIPTSSGFLTDTGVLAGASQFNAMPTQVTDTKSSGGFNVCLLELLKIMRIKSQSHRK